MGEGKGIRFVTWAVHGLEAKFSLLDLKVKPANQTKSKRFSIIHTRRHAKNATPKVV